MRREERVDLCANGGEPLRVLEEGYDEPREYRAGVLVRCHYGHDRQLHHAHHQFPDPAPHAGQRRTTEACVAPTSSSTRPCITSFPPPSRRRFKNTSLNIRCNFSPPSTPRKRAGVGSHGRMSACGVEPARSHARARCTSARRAGESAMSRPAAMRVETVNTA